MHRHGRWALPLLLVVGAAVFLAGISWGLPSDAPSAYLFGTHPVWSGKQIMALARPTDDANRGADVASHVFADRRTIVVVNATDEDRARIVRRYRLMSYQPDEWNTLKALSEMKPGRGDFDPKLYQYGGLWVYPVGAMLKAASVFHLIDLRGDVVWYLDDPAAFARFYVVARLWSVVWALIGIIAIYALVRRIVGGWVFPSAASLCFIFMPVVVNMAHEAKPHLAGTVLTLLAVLAAARYVERGTRRAWILAGVLCGAAFSMVLTTLPVFLILPAMTMLRRSSWRSKIAVSAGSIAIGGLVDLLTNPYVPINFVRHRALLESNLGNSSAMYHPRITADGLINTVYLIAAGTSPLLAIAGGIGALALGMRAVSMRKIQDPAEICRRATGLLLAIPALCVMGQCLLVATGKPGEFGRFLLLADVFLMVEAIVAIATFLPVAWAARPCLSAKDTGGPPVPRRIRSLLTAIAFAVLIATTAIPGIAYLLAFVRDSGSTTDRLLEARRIQQLNPTGDRTLAIYADPAPYDLPPVDLFHGKILLMPKNAADEEGTRVADISVRAVDVAPAKSGQCKWQQLWTATPISWADKPFEVSHSP